jgi:hypothetical protein
LERNLFFAVPAPSFQKNKTQNREQIQESQFVEALRAERRAFQKAFVLFNPVDDAVQKRPYDQPYQKEKNGKNGFKRGIDIHSLIISYLLSKTNMPIRNKDKHIVS